MDVWKWGRDCGAGGRSVPPSVFASSLSSLACSLFGRGWSLAVGRVMGMGAGRRPEQASASAPLPAGRLGCRAVHQGGHQGSRSKEKEASSSSPSRGSRGRPALRDRKEGALPQGDLPAPCAGVWTGVDRARRGARGKGRDPKVQPEAGPATSPETPRRRTAQDSVSLAARPRLGVKTVSGSSGLKGNSPKGKHMASVVVKPEARAPLGGKWS